MSDVTAQAHLDGLLRLRIRILLPSLLEQPLHHIAHRPQHRALALAAISARLSRRKAPSLQTHKAFYENYRRWDCCPVDISRRRSNHAENLLQKASLAAATPASDVRDSVTVFHQAE